MKDFIRVSPPVNLRLISNLIHITVQILSKLRYIRKKEQYELQFSEMEIFLID